MRLTSWICAGVLFASGDISAIAVSDENLQEAINACRVLEDAQRRLACYDAIPGASVTGGAAEAEPVAERDEQDDKRWIFGSADGTPLERSRMMRRWELDDAAHGGLLRIRAYKPIYALPARFSSSPNERPESPTLGPPENPDRLDDIEAKFQISLKTKLWDNLIADNGDVWVGFTQQSNWQAYNSLESEPFSRSWNRVYGYGESLIDYNHKQTTVGLGVSLVQ